MPSSQQPVEPTPFEAPPVTSAPEFPQQATQDPRGDGRWVVPALGMLLLLALAVFFWLPQQVPDPAPNPVATGSAQPSAPAAQPPAAPPAEAIAPDAAPWVDGQQLKLRKEAQDILEQLLNTQFQLEETGVAQWAPDDFAAALAFAGQGDELYRQREFSNAAEAYNQALAALQTLQGELPAARAQTIEQAGKAIEALAEDTALAALDLADQMAPEQGDLAELRGRAGHIPELVKLLQAAASEEATGDLEAATGALAAAVDLDPEHRQVAAEHARLVGLLTSQQFNSAMSEGFAALAANEFGRARRAFNRAAELQPDSKEVQGALAQLANADTSQQLANLQARGNRQEAQEQWSQAIEIYERALQIDRAVLFAHEGLARSRPRAALDRELQAVLDAPQRLQELAVARETEQLLVRARQSSPRGAVLTAQIERLEVALEKANTPVTVSLQSDLETDVTLYKVARLGRFRERELTLRPGTYTALGTRNGYRDVRRTFTVAVDSDTPAVSIVCTEPI